MFSKIVRRTHMYLALFLMPWMLMYALSTLAMNHRLGAGGPAWEKEREQIYTGTFAAGATPRAMAEQILSALHLDGLHSVSGSAAAGRLLIQRHDLVTPRRITFTPAGGSLLVERQQFRMSVFLERMHRRRGFRSDFAIEDAWAVLVDVAIVGMLFWVASGLWMWWEMRATRGWGALTAAGGLGLFALFLATI